ncbi:MAG: tetraacyldisaccharide 4'-kinase [Armatimonadetes bacterium]|nr:tetraacyldisaccharide 4'-kinase [Armatimonadota bacterium]
MQWHRIHNPETSADWAISTALLPLSWIYGLGWRAYAAVYQLGLKKRRRFETPILGVGNLEVGGSGKTPATIAVARLLAGKSIAISSSAYGSPSSRDASLVEPGLGLNPAEHGDEACLIREELPEVALILGRDRVRAAEIAQDEGFDALILDDGFQHLPLARAADVIMWEGLSRNRRLLPAGPLREPAGGLRRAAAAFSDSGECSYLKTFAYRREYTGLRELLTGQEHPIEWLRGREVNAICAIGKPRPFLDALESLAARLHRSVVLADHDDLQSADIAPGHAWVTTAKDAVKLRGRANVPENVFVLDMRIRFCKEAELSDWLNRTLLP